MYGTLWARNRENINRLREIDNGRKLTGVYILCDGSMPVYIGRGRIWKRILRHKRSKIRRHFWDHFSWYALHSRLHENELEALLLRLLPFYLRSLNKQRARLPNANKRKQANDRPDPIRRPKFGLAKPRR